MGKKFEKSSIIPMHRLTYKTSSQHFCGYERKKVRYNFHRNLVKLQVTVQILGKGQLGFGPMELGAKYLCYEAAMSMYLT